MIRALKQSSLVTLIAVALCGCGSGGTSSAIKEAPADWSALAGKSVTFEGAAGNSPRGPLIRFDDGSVVGLGRFKFWPVTMVSRQVGVVGTVAVGEGQRYNEYVLNVDRWYVVKQAVDTKGGFNDSPAMEDPKLPVAPAKKPAKK